MASDPNDPRRREPGPDHPITISSFAGTVTIRLGDTLIASSHKALVLNEGGYPPIYYVPLDDLEPGVTAPSDKATYCPFKGEASYLSLVTASGNAPDAIWAYPDAYDAVAPIRGHVAFDSRSVSVEVAGL